MNDGELAAHLDDPDDWLVLDAAGRPILRSITLRHALHQVQLCLSAGVMPRSLVRHSGQPATVVPMEQLYRMRKVTRARERVQRGERRVARQRQIVHELKAQGHNAREAELLLGNMGASLKTMRRYLEVVESELLQ
jgi:hypothetical protein